MISEKKIKHGLHRKESIEEASEDEENVDSSALGKFAPQKSPRVASSSAAAHTY